MSTARVFRFIIGIVIAAILLSVLLPVLGVPRSRFLPPNLIYNTADGVTRGYVTAKYYDVTGNPFNVGGKQYFLRYQITVKAPGPKGLPDLGPMTTYKCAMRFKDDDKGIYDQQPLQVDKSTADKYVNQQDIPVASYPVKVRYVKSDPEINGIDAPWGTRNFLNSSGLVSGWIVWVVVTIALGYGIMMLLERFSNTENI